MNKKVPFLFISSLLAFALLVGCNNKESSNVSSEPSSSKEPEHVHNYGEVTYSWSADYSTCTAERVCKDDASHKETETVNSVYKVVNDSTCSAEGIGRYTATFVNSAFNAQIHDTAINKKDHVWDNGEITKYPNIYEDGVKTYHCQNCDATREEKVNKVNNATNYTLNATKMDGLTGVYTAKAVVGADKKTATMGIPKLAKENLVDYPTYDSPAIIQGAAVEYEVKKGAVEYEKIPGGELIAPYEYFRYSITDVESKDADGNITKYKKLSGFDATYYIIRVDVSDLVANKTGYLHVKQTDNKALMVQVGMQGGVDTHMLAANADGTATTRPTINGTNWAFGDLKTDIPVIANHNNSLAYADANGNWFVGGTGFADGMGIKVATYSLADNFAALKDKTGNYKETPYLDVIVLSSGKLAAGADAGKESAPTSDISLSLYVDETLDYNPSLTYDPTSQDVNHATNVMNKFFDESKMVAANNASSYVVKGSDLEIDVVTKETQNAQDVNEYWSLTKAMDYQPYDSHTIKLMSEVPVLEGLLVKSKTADKRTVILDVNSFDIQIANHSETNAAGLVVANNASLEILDSSNTVGAELAIGNNATMEVQDGGTLIIDETCQLEVEYDAASNVHDTTHYTVAQVIEKITALPNPSDIKEANRADVNAAKDAYDALTEEEKPQVTNVDKLNQCIAALPKETPLSNGEITVKKGGKMINEGIVNIEGLEVKPAANNTQETTQRVDRDMKSASLLIEEGATFENYGCIGVRGDLYLLGTLNNYGKYNELIAGTDPDKGTVNHHKGIQISWKDDVTVLKEGSQTEYTVNPDVRPGTLHVGKDANGNVHDSAKLNNYGDIVLCPGVLEVYGSYANLANKDGSTGNLYVCAISEAVVPITPTQAEPNKLEERRAFSPAYQSTLDKDHAKSFVATPITATIEILSNGIYGKLTPIQ